MTEQVEEISTINVRELVVENKGTWWLIPECPSHSFFSFFLKINPVILNTQRDVKVWAQRAVNFLYKNGKYPGMKVLRSFVLELLVFVVFLLGC